MTFELSAVMQAYNPCYLGGRDKGITVQSQPGQESLRLYLKNKLKQKDWGGGSSGRVPA
jgi:hypothetical protein